MAFLVPGPEIDASVYATSSRLGVAARPTKPTELFCIFRRTCIGNLELDLQRSFSNSFTTSLGNGGHDLVVERTMRRCSSNFEYY